MRRQTFGQAYSCRIGEGHGSAQPASPQEPRSEGDEKNVASGALGSWLGGLHARLIESLYASNCKLTVV